MITERVMNYKTQKIIKINTKTFREHKQTKNRVCQSILTPPGQFYPKPTHFTQHLESRTNTLCCFSHARTSQAFNLRTLFFGIRQHNQWIEIICWNQGAQVKRLACVYMRIECFKTTHIKNRKNEKQHTLRKHQHTLYVCWFRIEVHSLSNP